MIIAYATHDKIVPSVYFLNRFARIYPLLVLSVIPLIIGALLGFGINNIADSFINLLSIQAWIPGKALIGNGPAWSLTVEVFFYALFPFLYNFFYKNGLTNKIAIVIILIWLVSILLQNYLLNSDFYRGYPSASHDLLYYFPLLHLNQFLIGNLAGLLFLKYRNSAGKNYDFQLLIVLTLFFLLLRYPLGIDYHNGFMAIIFAPIILLIATNTGIFTILLSSKPLVFLGEISYGIYILQYPVFKITELLYVRFGFINLEIQFYIYSVVLLISAAVSHLIIERPLRDKIKSLRANK